MNLLMNGRQMVYLFVLLFFAPTLYAVQTSVVHYPERLVESLKNDPQAGKYIYLEFCAVCHQENPDIALGAPRKGIPEDWQSRSPHVADLMKSVIEGQNAMPARGGCFECTDALLEAAVRYMLPTK